MTTPVAESFRSRPLNALLAITIVVLLGLAGAGEAREAVIIGDASMLEDGTIVINMRRTADGIDVSGVITYKVADPHYQEVLDHLGGMTPGEVKLVPAWDEDNDPKE